MKRRQFIPVGIAAAAVVIDRSAALAWSTVNATPVLTRDATPVFTRNATPVFTLRNPGCPCCVGWVEHMNGHGFEVHLHDSPALADVKRRLGIPDDLTSCHTSVVEGYRVEGHIPAEFVRRLLDEKPAVIGIAVPGMPTGSPGMEGANPQSYDVIAFTGSGPEERSVFGSVTIGD